MGSVTLQAPGVNSGNAFTLHGTQVRYIWKNLNNKNPHPGSWTTAEVDTAGFENPTIRVSGVIDANSDIITWARIKEFARVQFDGTTSTAIKLTITAGSAISPFTLKDYSETNSFIYVVIEYMDLNFGTEIKEGAKLMYSIDFVETAIR